MKPDAASCLLFQAGDAIVCPECDYLVLIYQRDVTAERPREGRVGFGEVGDPLIGPLGAPPANRCPRCDGQFLLGPRSVVVETCRAVDHCPRVFVSSGFWTGWRELGGE